MLGFVLACEEFRGWRGVQDGRNVRHNGADEEHRVVVCYARNDVKKSEFYGTPNGVALVMPFPSFSSLCHRIRNKERTRREKHNWLTVRLARVTTTRKKEGRQSPPIWRALAPAVRLAGLGTDKHRIAIPRHRPSHVPENPGPQLNSPWMP
jgi:hypothetical protein